MRRTLIYLMLSIIVYSTFMSILPYWAEPEKYQILLDTVYGAVAAGNFSYWTFGQKGLLIIELTSVTGDADLFVGDNIRTSYEADRNNFSSETCGIDVVYVPVDFPRPIVIGVYGQWPHSISEFSMKVFGDVDKQRSRSSGADERPISGPQARMVESTQNRDKPSLRPEVISRKEDEKPRLLQFYRVLDTMFGLLV